MKKYEVLAPFVTFSVKDEQGKPKEYALKRGDSVELPEADISVRAMVIRRQIKEATTEPKTKK